MPAPQTTVPMEDLTNGSPYTFQVAAVNAAGEGDRSAYSNTETPTGVPAAPTGVSAVRMSPDTTNQAFMTMTFTPGSDNGGEQTFTIKALVGGAESGSYPNASPNAKVGPLQPGQCLHLRRRARKTGPAQQPGTSASPITAFVRPDPPTIVQTLPGNDDVYISGVGPVRPAPEVAQISRTI